MDHRKHTKFNKFKKFSDVTSVVVTIKMAIIQHLMNFNRRKKLYTCRIKEGLNRIFKEIFKATEVAKVQISLMARGNKILTILLSILLTILLQVLTTEVHNNKLKWIDCQKWKIP